MSETGNQIIFKQLLEQHPQVEIPLIQRDYAQGRVNENEVRDRFLKKLREALHQSADDPSLPLNLDFIYGSVEGDGETKFLPLDGQQRLTTLFLLHWYLAWQDGRLDDFRATFVIEDKSRFSYSVRPSSQEFFDELVMFTPEEAPSETRSLQELVCDQPWYFRSWRLDTSIQSALVMLDTIHTLFREDKGLFARLYDVDHPAITFQLLDLENFGLSDDLYIKMNSRGKPLTAFETFKARYEELLDDQFEDVTRPINGHPFALHEFVAQRFDTRWSDLFWAYRDSATHLYDSAVMNVFRAIAMATRDPDDSRYTDENLYVDDIGRLRNAGLASSYSEFETHNWMDPVFARTLIALLEVWSQKGGGFTKLLPNGHYFDEDAIFAKLMTTPTTLTYTEVVQLAAYASFVREYEETIDPQVFQEWMRVTFNLSVNTTYDRPSELQRSVSGIKSLLPHSQSILEHFKDSKVPATGFNLEQISEEKLKAELILGHTGWRSLIDQAEQHGYFRGQIGFLLDFSGVIFQTTADNIANWNATDHERLQEQCAEYLCKATAMFGPDGLRGFGNYEWHRALLSCGDYLLKNGQNHSFLVNSATEPTSWKRLLRDDSPQRKFLRDLWDQIDVANPIKEQLNAIIKSATVTEAWRKAFVQSPKAIAYCEKHLIRWISADEIYLLKKSQMNGAHAELFTYRFYCDVLESLAQKGDLAPLCIQEYKSVNTYDIDDPPHILLEAYGSKGGLNFIVKIGYWNGNFQIRIGPITHKNKADFIEELRNSLGYLTPPGTIAKLVKPSAMKKAVTDLVGVVGTYF